MVRVSILQIALKIKRLEEQFEQNALPSVLSDGNALASKTPAIFFLEI